MSQNDLLYTIIQEFNSSKADMSPTKVTSQDMGYIFEELIRKFSESYDEQAGAHFRIDSLPKALVDFLNIEEVRIFGSYARNEQTVNSDYDFLVVTNDVNHDDDLTRSLLGKYFEENFGEHFDIVAIDINQKTLNPFEFVVLLSSKEIKRFGVI